MANGKDGDRVDSTGSPTQLIDTHCHLDFPQFDSDREEVLERAISKGVIKIINPGTDLESSQRAVALAQKYDHIFAAVGVHPHDASTLDRATLTRLRQLAAHPKVVAIGEIGLDFYRDLSPRNQQQAAFEAQLELANELNLPVIIHQREAAEDVMTTLKHWAATGHPGCVLHAFSGDQAVAEEAAVFGFFIGIGGPITFKNARQLPALLPRLPLDHLLIETDAPYLSPHPFRGKRNEPGYVLLVAQHVAELLGMPISQLVNQLKINTCRLFRRLEAGA